MDGCGRRHGPLPQRSLTIRERPRTQVVHVDVGARMIEVDGPAMPMNIC